MRWEYLVIELYNQSQRVDAAIGKWNLRRMPDAEGVLNALGEDGWEVVALQGGTQTNLGQVILKRPRPSA